MAPVMPTAKKIRLQQAVAIQTRWRGHSLRARMAPFFATWRRWLDAASGEEANIAATVIARQYRGWQVP